MTPAEDSTAPSQRGGRARSGVRRRGPFATMFAARRAESDPEPSIEESLPRGIRLAGAWSWRLLVVGAVIAVVIFLIIQLRLIVIPVLIAILLSALLVPFVAFLHRHGWPRWLGIVTAMVGLIVVVSALVMLAVMQIRGEFPELRTRSTQAYDGLRTWLVGPPFNFTDAQLDGYLGAFWSALQQDSQVLISGAVSIGSTVGHVLAGLLLTLFSTLFILIDGAGIWAWVVRIFPRRSRAAIDGAGKAGWGTLRNFVRVQILVATIDAIGIGLGAFFLGLPLVVPIAVLVFLGSFIPIVGAVVTGALAVVIALVYNGWLVAVIMLAVVLLVQQIEGHVLQPLIMGSAVKVHPLAVVLVVRRRIAARGHPGGAFRGAAGRRAQRHGAVHLGRIVAGNPARAVFGTRWNALADRATTAAERATSGRLRPIRHSGACTYRHAFAHKLNRWLPRPDPKPV